MDISIWQNNQLYYPLLPACGSSAAGYKLIPGYFLLSDSFFFFFFLRIICFAYQTHEEKSFQF